MLAIMFERLKIAAPISIGVLILFLLYIVVLGIVEYRSRRKKSVIRNRNQKR